MRLAKNLNSAEVIKDLKCVISDINRDYIDTTRILRANVREEIKKNLWDYGYEQTIEEFLDGIISGDVIPDNSDIAFDAGYRAGLIYIMSKLKGYGLAVDTRG